MLHGEADQRVPVTVSEALAGLEPDLVVLHKFPNALHAEAWNFDSVRWNTEVAAFLSK